MKNAVETLARRFRLPETTTPENLECLWSKTLTFGEYVLTAGYYFNGVGQNSHFGAVYAFTTDDHTCEGAIRLVAVSEDFFEDQGHAIAWALDATKGV